MTMEKNIEKVARLIGESSKIVVFTGAGVSTESGIPDFRSQGGIWDRFDPAEFTYQSFVASEENRKKRWKFYREMFKTFADTEPNATHLAIAELETMGKLLAVITQNIDALHQKAGNSPEKVIELHGTIEKVKCLDCGDLVSQESVSERLEQGEEAPYCRICNGILKPATISFGESMPMEEMRRAEKSVSECDLCLCIGSSLVVYPAAQFPTMAKQRGAKLVVINREPTHADSSADVVIHDLAGKTMSKIMSAVRGDR
ncbi:MAG: SIR2 family NAD-dependent protein deacylase [Dethiobacteria bacterium]|jgi:NAD-dependent deacetylase